MDRKKYHACPTQCSHPNVGRWGGSLTPAKQKNVDEIQGESKEIMFCGHCDTVWVEFRINENDYQTGNVWYKRIYA